MKFRQRVIFCGIRVFHPVGLGILAIVLATGQALFAQAPVAAPDPTATPDPTAAPVPAAPAKNQLAAASAEGVRLKDLARIVGVRNNQLLGYGLVVGLPGTGDSRSRLASNSIQNLLGSLDARLEGAGSGTRNIAAVLVTAEIPPFAKRGDKVDVVVSSIGDARSLEGGVLVQTPLYAGDKKIYGVAQGVVTTGGRSNEQGDGRRQPKTVGNVLSGAHVERDVDMNYLADRRLRVSLVRFDFATLHDVGLKVGEIMPEAKVQVDGGSLLLDVPKEMDTVAFIAKLEEIRIVPKYRARVVINERSGTIVMGGDVKVDPVAISRGGLQIIITGPAEKKSPEKPALYQSDARGEKEKPGPATHAFAGASIAEIIQALNSLGASVQDIIAILEALKDSGALHAELVVI